MIDPTKITKFNRTAAELEELLLFCIAVAGKNATSTARNLQKFLDYASDEGDSPFDAVRRVYYRENLPQRLKSLGFGCYNLKAKGFAEVALADIDLRTCTVEQLEQFSGIGMKTSRYFVLHTRPNARIACLDTHILKWLAAFSGVEVPKQTPTNRKYLRLEQLFLNAADALKIDSATLDLKIWMEMSGRNAAAPETVRTAA